MKTLSQIKQEQMRDLEHWSASGIEVLDLFADRLVDEIEKAVVPDEVVYSPNGDHTTCSNSVNRTEGWNKCRERVRNAFTRFKGGTKDEEDEFVCPFCGADWADAEMIGDPEYNDMWLCKCGKEYGSAVLKSRFKGESV